MIPSLLCALTYGNGLVGPGGMVPHSQGSGNRRYGGSVRVREPAEGFFVGGSSIDELNGLFGRVHAMPEALSERYSFELAYRHDQTGWIMSVATEKPAEVEQGAPPPPSPRSKSWYFFDAAGNERFTHEGNTIIPGAGQRWSHVRNDASATDVATGDASEEPRDMEELPWQVIAILNAQMLARMRNHQRWHDNNIQEAIGGGGEQPMLPPVDGRAGAVETAPPAELASPLTAVGAAVAHLDPSAVVCADAPEGALGSALDARIASFGAASREEHESRWAEAVLRVYNGRCHRHARNFDDAERELALALALFPRYAIGIHERALLSFDQSRYSAAIEALELVLRVERNFPSVDKWLARAHAFMSRAGIAADLQREGMKAATDEIARLDALRARETPECVAWRQTANCDPNGKREARFDVGCTDIVHGGASGYCECTRDVSLLVGGGGGAAAEADAAGGSKIGHRTAELSCNHAPLTCAAMCTQAWTDAVSAATARLSSEAEVNALVAAAQLADAERTAAYEAAKHALLQEERAARSGLNNAPYDHYALLSVRCDIDPQRSEHDQKELKRAYKKASLVVHPDRGGSDEAFQAVAAAYETISDAAKRKVYDIGEDLKREQRRDGTFGPNHAEKIARKYFPERFHFEPFGDPHQDRKERAEWEAKRLADRQQQQQQQEHTEL